MKAILLKTQVSMRMVCEVCELKSAALYRLSCCIQILEVVIFVNLSLWVCNAKYSLEG